MMHDITSFCRFFFLNPIWEPFGAVYQGSYSFELFIFHDFFSMTFLSFQDLRFSYHLPKFSKFPLFCWGIF